MGTARKADESDEATKIGVVAQRHEGRNCQSSMLGIPEVCKPGVLAAFMRPLLGKPSWIWRTMELSEQVLLSKIA